MSSKKVFSELALKNVKKSARDYLIYFFTVTFAVCLFYTFNSMKAQLGAMEVDDTLSYMSAATSVLAGVSVFVCLIMGFLVAYANQFLLKRRKREMGIYMTLGMGRKDINRLLMKESTTIGLISLVAGLLLGVFTSQGLYMVSTKIIGVGDGSFHFVLSPIAAIASVFFFGLLFFFVHIFNTKKIKKMRLIDLIYADRKNETMSVNRIRGAIFFILSLALLASGYTFIAAQVTNSFFKNVVIAMLLISCGIGLFIASFADVVLPLMKRNKKLYLKGLNMVAISQLSSKLKSASLSTAVVSIMLFLSVVTMSFGLGMGHSLLADMDTLTPYDASIVWVEGEQGAHQTIVKELEKQGVSKENLGRDVSEIKTYHLKGLGDSPVISQEDYNRAMKLQGKKGVKLTDKQFTVAYSAEKWKSFYEDQKGGQKQQIKINNTVLKMKSKSTQVESYVNNNVSLEYVTFIVPGGLLDGMKSNSIICNIQFGSSVQDQNQWFWSVKDKAPKNFRVDTKHNIITEITSNRIMTTYIGVYLGISLLITAGAVLAIQQLSQSSDNQRMYRLMRKMGAAGKDLKQSILRQVGIYFGLPLVLCTINAGAMIGILFSQIPDLTVLTIAQSILFSAGIAAVIYSVYFITTYVGSKQMLKL